MVLDHFSNWRFKLRKHSSNFCAIPATTTLLLYIFLAGCASSNHTIMGPPGKLTLSEAEKQLQESKQPIQRTRNYIQISDILLRNARNETPPNSEALLNQYRDSILSAQDNLTSLKKSTKRYPKEYMKFETTLRHHIRWLSDWKL